jgi:POT family proton-dependent oligopeptide transporter
MGSIVTVPLYKTETERHPKEIYRLGFTAMWDMFSYYGMKALLIAYIVTQLRLGEQMGYAILGTYAAFIFGLNFFGGLVSDKLLGNRKAIIWGGYLQITGHIILAIPSNHLFFIGLAFVATGAGFRMAPSGSLVNSFYRKDQFRKKEDGYAMLYMIFNFGAALGGLICGYLGQNINWHLGFGAACIFMIIGQAQFIFSINKLHGVPPALEKLKKIIFLRLFNREHLIYFFSLIVVGMVALVLNFPGFMNLIMMPLTFIAFVYIIYISFKYTKHEREKIFAVLLICLIGSLFWAFYEQIGGSLSLFSMHNVDFNIAGLQLSGLAINSFTAAAWLIVLIPISIKIWKWLDNKKLNPRSYIKLMMSFVFMAICFFILWLGCVLNNDTGIMPFGYLIVAYFFIEMGEICLGPMLYSLVANLSPKNIISTLWGIMTLCNALGAYLSGKIGSLMIIPEGITNPIVMMPYFSSIFLKIGIGSLLISLLIISLFPLLKKWMHEVH